MIRLSRYLNLHSRASRQTRLKAAQAELKQDNIYACRAQSAPGCVTFRHGDKSKTYYPTIASWNRFNRVMRAGREAATEAA